MSRLKIIFMLIPLIGFSIPGPLKECGMDDLLTQEDYMNHLSDYPGIPGNNRDILWVPVTFHVVRMDNQSGGLSPDRLNTGIEDLNTAAGNSDMRYYQFGQTDYIDDTNFYSGIDSYDEIDSLRSVNHVPNTLNIYCVAVLNTGNSDLCGISTFSWYESQGIIIANNCFATPDNHTTLPHEAGHYFDLFHTHQGSADHDEDGVIDGENAEFADGTECAVRGDGLCDTVADPTLTGLVSDNCNYFGTFLDGHLQPYDPDTHNMMSYSVKHCRDGVTPEQYARMEYTYLTFRPELNIQPVEPNITLSQFTIHETEGDGDDILNPGETAEIWVVLENHPDWPDGTNIVAYLESSNEEITIFPSDFITPILNAGGSVDNSSSPFFMSFDGDAALGGIELELMVNYQGSDGTPFTMSFPIPVDLSLNQAGWPVFAPGDTVNQVQGSPLVIHTNSDEIATIFFADYNGTIFSVNPTGEGIENALFPFHAGNSIWGDLAAFDIDNDGHIEIIAPSKDKHLYVLDVLDQTINLDYNADQFLMSAVAIGNGDDDAEQEIFFGGFTTSGQLFGINPDGSDLPGFPVQINEKIRGGIAVADVNGNGKVDIVVGTEGYHIWLITDGGAVAEGYPYPTEGRIRTAPAILSAPSGIFILAGDDRGYLYALTPQGGLRFLYDAGTGITTGMGFTDSLSGPLIFFGTIGGEIHGVTLEGISLPGWPVVVGSSVNSSPVMADLNNDGLPEIISGTTAGAITAFNLQGDSYPFFPVQNEFQVMGTPTVADIDQDGDCEILVGTTHTVLAIDNKEPGTSAGYWNTFQGSPLRTGYFQSILVGECGNPIRGDLNCDALIDILDAVRLVQIIVHPEETPATEFEIWAGDLNNDEITDILDVVNLVNLIVN